MMQSSTQSIQVVLNGGIEQFEKPMPSHHWLRNKKQSVHFIHDSPFATERQLEDQRLLMQKNRNPQAYIATKVDKVRSETISASLGASRPVAVKANVLNKIVRESSGVHNYTIIAPPRVHGDKKEKEKLDPETNPRVRAYAKEAKMKPVIVSFGHRPRSASRTFHPATMRFRLKHSEIAHGGDNINKTGFGLPVAVLAQVLRAPKIYHTSEADSLFRSAEHGNEFSRGARLEDSSEANDNIDSTFQDENGRMYEDLFFSEEEKQKMFKTKGKSAPTANKQSVGHNLQNSTAKLNENDYSDSGLEKPSWVSSTVGSTTKKQAKSYPIDYPELEPVQLKSLGVSVSVCICIIVIVFVIDFAK
jgi:hypothetical protein